MPDESRQKDWKSTVITLLCVLQIIVAALSVVASIIVLVGGSFLGGLGGNMLTEVGASSFQSTVFGKLISYLFVSYTGLGSLFLITSIVDFVGGILGIRAAKNPSKMKPFLVLTVIGLVVSVVRLVASLASAVFSWTSLVGVVTHAILLALAFTMRQRNKATTKPC